MFQIFLMKKHLEKHVLKCRICLSANKLTRHSTKQPHFDKLIIEQDEHVVFLCRVFAFQFCDVATLAIIMHKRN